MADDAGRTPNVIVIFIDDMGYADIGPFGCKDYPTPNIDRMAKEGRVFTDFQVAQAVCSASRAALMTGCYSNRVSILGALGPQVNYGISDEEVTIAQICKQKNYATAAFGKWHLGHHPKFLPVNHGFDEYFGLPYSNDMWPFDYDHNRVTKGFKSNYPTLPLIENDHVADPDITPEKQPMLTTWYTEHAVSFIDRNKDKPFFLYLPHSMVHVPLFVSDKFKGKSGAGLFGDVMMEVDWSVGQVLDAVRRNGLEKNTLVIFTADNGPWLNFGNHAGKTGGLREGKGTMFEGGSRNATIMWQPGTVPAGTKCDTMAMTIDILPTVAHLIGAKLPDHKIDGLNIWPLITGESDKSPHEAYFMYYGQKLEAVRTERWKLHLPHDYRHYIMDKVGHDGHPGPYGSGHIDFALYDMDNDVNETTDVKDQHPDVVAHLKELADEMRKDLGDAGKPGPGIRKHGVLEPGDKKLEW
ncbi:MAG: sulfatase-like hydrolase/transferase [Planctomycetes bacterium]|nr:sulfatase-like hydrolase/transferase [Planctomycetota bacterium]